MEQIILTKNIFLPHFEIVQNFHYFVRSAPVDFLSKIQFSKNCLKCCRNVSFNEWNTYLCQKKITYPISDSTKFSLFCKVPTCQFVVKYSFFSKKCLKCCRIVSFDEWNKQLAKKYFLAPFLDSTKLSLLYKVRICVFSVN